MLYRFIQLESKIAANRIFFMLFFSGLATGFLIYVINHAADTIRQQRIDGQTLFLYFVLFFLYIYTQKYTLSHTIYPFNQALQNLRQRLTLKTLRCESLTLEGLPRHVLQERLSHEINLIAQLLPWITYSAQALTIVLFSLLYLAHLTIAVFFMVFLTLLGTAAWHFLVEKKIHQELNGLRADEITFAEKITELSDFATEIKQHPARFHLFWESSQRLSEQIGLRKNVIDQQAINSILSTRIALFLLLAIFVFILPLYSHRDEEIIFKVTVVTFFIMGPLAQIVYALPQLFRLDAALSGIYQFEQFLDTVREEALENPSETKSLFAANYFSIRWSCVGFSYQKSPDHPAPWYLKEFNATIQPGELILLDSHNGGGKTTLLKLISGLYPPDTGSIYVDKHRLQNTEYSDYRDLFSVVFRDGPPPTTPIQPVDEGMVSEWLQQMDLAGQVEFADGHFHHPGLSRSLQWRLALLCALLEDKPIVILDDFALGQDETFSAWLLDTLIQPGQKSGKTFILATRHTLPQANQQWRIEDGIVQVTRLEPHE